MPGGDRTGPMGAGPMTGRGAGYCAGYDNPGFGAPFFGRGRGGGRGFGRGGFGGGRGWRHRYYATGLPGWARGDYDYRYPNEPVSPEGDRVANRVDEAASLESRLRYHQGVLRDIEVRLERLKDQQADSGDVSRDA